MKFKKCSVNNKLTKIKFDPALKSPKDSSKFLRSTRRRKTSYTKGRLNKKRNQ